MLNHKNSSHMLKRISRQREWLLKVTDRRRWPSVIRNLPVGWCMGIHGPEGQRHTHTGRGLGSSENLQREHPTSSWNLLGCQIWKLPKVYFVSKAQILTARVDFKWWRLNTAHPPVQLPSFVLGMTVAGCPHPYLPGSISLSEVLRRFPHDLFSGPINCSLL